MKKYATFLLALALVGGASGCSTESNQKNKESNSLYEDTIVSNFDEALPVSVDNSSEVLLLNGFSYGEWTNVFSFESDVPFVLISTDTCRILSNGYTIDFDSGSHNIIYQYIIQERMRTSLYEKTTLSKDETGEITVSDRSGKNIEIDDSNYTEWQDKERFSATEPSTIYTNELERVISDEYEVTADENGNIKIIFHYIRQTRQHK